MGDFSRKLRLAFLFSIGLLCHSQAGALTLSEVRTEARQLDLDTGTSRRRFSDARINAWINEAHRLAILEARPIVRSGEIQLAIGTTYYNLPSDFLSMSRVSLDYDQLYEITPEALDKESRWPTVGALPTHYLIDFASRTKVGVYPYPSDSSSTGTLRYQYFAQATDLSADSDVPFNNLTELKPYHYRLAYYAAAQMAAIDGKGALAMFYFSQFRSMVEQLKTMAKDRPSYRPAAIGRRE